MSLSDLATRKYTTTYTGPLRMLHTRLRMCLSYFFPLFSEISFICPLFLGAPRLVRTHTNALYAHIPLGCSKPLFHLKFLSNHLEIQLCILSLTKIPT